MRRGEIWWASLGDPAGSEPGFRRPVLIVSSNAVNLSGLKTLLAVPVTTNLSREHYEENVRLPAKQTGLPRTSIGVVGLLAAINKVLLTERIGRVPDALMAEIDKGLRLVLAL